MSATEQKGKPMSSNAASRYRSLPARITAVAAGLFAMVCLALTCGMGLGAQNAYADTAAPADGKELKILFTHDIHSFLEPTEGYVEGEVREHGGAARLATLLKANSDENTIYVDAGDFSQGTLFQAGYETGAYELRMLGELGCDVTTPGNHEWDHAGKGFATMLKSAMKSGSPLPKMVQSNLDFSGDLTAEQQEVKDTLGKYGAMPYVILHVNGLNVGVFGLSGIESIEDSPTSGMNWIDYKEAAKTIVDELQGQVDVIVCLSHSGTEGDGENGEDFELADEVPGIDVIISGHSHSAYHEVVQRGETFVGSTGEYLNNLGSMTLNVAADGSVTCTDYALLPIDDSVAADPAMEEIINGYKKNIQETYLKDYNASYDEVICYSNFDFMPLGEMYATHQEYPLGDLIADSYLYEAQKNGINDIDVALVGLGTVRGSFFKGPITTADAFEICSLGVGADGSAGHPLLTAYVTGKELKLLVELDASLGPVVSAIKMSYGGLAYTFNEKRTLLDRVTEVNLVRADGTTEEIADDQLYKVCCNMYAANMLGMLNGLTKGALKIVPKYADGTPVEDFYTCSILNPEGKEVKEWVAFRDYLMSFDKGKGGLPVIPDVYQAAQDRKVKVSEGGFAKLKNPGATTIIVNVLGWLVVILVLVFGERLNMKMKRKQYVKTGEKPKGLRSEKVIAQVEADRAAGGDGTGKKKKRKKNAAAVDAAPAGVVTQHPLDGPEEGEDFYAGRTYSDVMSDADEFE